MPCYGTVNLHARTVREATDKVLRNPFFRAEEVLGIHRIEPVTIRDRIRELIEA